MLGSRRWTASTTSGACRASAPSRSSPTSRSSTTRGRAARSGWPGGALGAGGFNTPMFRHAIERMDPAHYLTSGVLRALADRGGDAPGGGRLPHARRARRPRRPVPAVAAGHGVGGRRRRGDRRCRCRASRWATRCACATTAFAGHTRCPRYVRGRRGRVVAVEPRRARARARGARGREGRRGDLRGALRRRPSSGATPPTSARASTSTSTSTTSIPREMRDE